MEPIMAFRIILLSCFLLLCANLLVAQDIYRVNLVNDSSYQGRVVFLDSSQSIRLIESNNQDMLIDRKNIKNLTLISKAEPIKELRTVYPEMYLGYSHPTMLEAGFGVWFENVGLKVGASSILSYNSVHADLSYAFAHTTDIRVSLGMSAVGLYTITFDHIYEFWGIGPVASLSVSGFYVQLGLTRSILDYSEMEYSGIMRFGWNLRWNEK